MPPFRLSKSANDQIGRLADAVIAGVLLAFTVPLVIFVAVAIRLESPGPAFEREPCIGRGGRRFQMVQFRTTTHEPIEPRSGWAAKPQVTHVGAFLRYTRIDSLPQLLNVLAGEMSIVESDGRSPSFLSRD